MKILVTGGGGFIGKHVCQLLSQCHDVVALDQYFAERLPCSMVLGNLCDPDFLAGLFQTHAFNAIIHLASLRNSESHRQPDAAMRVNIGGSLSLLQMAQQFNVGKFIYGSSISAYGPKPFARYGAVAESEPAAPTNVYGLCKRYVETVGEGLNRSGRPQFVAVRIAMVVGRGVVSTASSWRGEIFEKLTARLPAAIRLPFDGDEIVPLIHVMDVAEIMRRLIEAEHIRHAIYNTPADNMRCGELATTLAALTPNIEVVQAPSGARGDPEAINGSRFAEEFQFQPLPVKEHLRLAS